MVQDQTRVVDGFLTAEGGVDSGFAPSMIGVNQLAWAVNTTVRGGFPKSRPGWLERPLVFPDPDPDGIEALFSTGLFQGAGSFINDDGVAFSAVSISGRIFLVNLQTYEVSEITIPGDQNQADRPRAWFQQAERYLIVQNGINRAFLYEGTTSRRSTRDEVPIGGPMAYGKGRLWVANGSEYVGGDLVWSDPTYGRDSVIRFTENVFLNGGGAFAVQNGPITGLAFAANLDTSLGDGDLLVFTPTSTYAFSAPIDREVWQDLEYPIQRFALLNFGATNHDAITPVNGDLFFRAQDGVRSLIYARRDFEMWGNTPISRQIHRALDYDTDQLLGYASACTFNNRMLMTTQPQQLTGRGVYHRGLVVLDFDLVSGMGPKFPPAWEGVWTGLRILRIQNVLVDRRERCFIWHVNASGVFKLFEVTKDAPFDYTTEAADPLDRDVPIQWVYETRSVTFNRPTEIKRLDGADQWYDQVMGNLSVTVRYRPNESSCWSTWGTFTDCAEYRNCAPGDPCQEVSYYKPSVRARVSLPQPPQQVDPQTGRMTNYGHEFQMRYEITGKARMKRVAMVAQRIPEAQFGDFSAFTCATAADVDCQTGCLALECAGVCSEPPDYGYQI